MANLTNSNKLISKIEEIDWKIWSIPAGSDVGQELQDIRDSIGTVPSGSNVMAEIGDVDDKVDAVSDSIGTVPAGSTVMDEIADVAGDLSDFESEVASTYATKSEISSVYKYKGSVADYSALPASGNTVGDVWNVEAAHTTAPVFDAGTNVAWNGSAWDPLAGVVDLSNYFNKTVDDSDDITEGSSHLFLTSAERTKLNNTSGVNTGDQSASDFDIKDLADSTDLRDTWSGKQDAISDLSDIRSWAAAGATALQPGDSTYVSNTIAEGADDKLTVTAADNVTIATAETNNKSAIAAIASAHNDLVDRVVAVEWATGSLPINVYFADVTLNWVSTVLNNENITTTSHISFVEKSGHLNGYALEKYVEAGKCTFTSSEAETATLEVMIINKKSS